METKRCKWCNEKNKIYIKYHDSEWGVKNEDNAYLFEMLILESFQAGLSWECILNKRDNFRKAYDNFDLNKVLNYDDKKDHYVRYPFAYMKKRPVFTREGRRIRKR